MRTLHSILDVNNDGVISYDDFQLVTQNFAALGNLKADAQQEFNDVMKQVWETLFGEITPYNLINAEQYLTEMHTILNDKKQRNKVHAFLPFLFKVRVIKKAEIAHSTSAMNFLRLMILLSIDRLWTKIIPASSRSPSTNCSSSA